MIRGFPVFPRIDKNILFHGMVKIFISGRSSDFRISHLSHLPGKYSQWRNVKSVPGYSGGSVLDLHEVPFLASYKAPEKPAYLSNSATESQLLFLGKNVVPRQTFPK